MLDWQAIDTVLLDMDGTLLDLHFDNYFWRHHVTVRYAEKHGLAFDESAARLSPQFRAAAGTLNWYCVDYWSQELALDIVALKEEVAHLIAIRPSVESFLSALHAAGKRVVLVTNAHSKSLDLKMRATGIDSHFDAILCSHNFGLPKEHNDFWPKLQCVESFHPDRTLLIDDSAPVLRAARAFGIRYLLSVAQPDSCEPARADEDFPAIGSFDDIMPDTANQSV